MQMTKVWCVKFYIQVENSWSNCYQCNQLSMKWPLSDCRLKLQVNFPLCPEALSLSRCQFIHLFFAFKNTPRARNRTKAGPFARVHSWRRRIKGRKKLVIFSSLHHRKVTMASGHLLRNCCLPSLFFSVSLLHLSKWMVSRFAFHKTSPPRQRKQTGYKVDTHTHTEKGPSRLHPHGKTAFGPCYPLDTRVWKYSYTCEGGRDSYFVLSTIVDTGSKTGHCNTSRNTLLATFDTQKLLVCPFFPCRYLGRCKVRRKRGRDKDTQKWSRLSCTYTVHWPLVSGRV